MIPMFLSFEWGDWVFRSPYLNAVTITGDRALDGQQGPDRVAEADPCSASHGGPDIARLCRGDRLSDDRHHGRP